MKKNIEYIFLIVGLVFERKQFETPQRAHAVMP